MDTDFFLVWLVRIWIHYSTFTIHYSSVATLGWGWVWGRWCLWARCGVFSWSIEVFQDSPSQGCFLKQAWLLNLPSAGWIRFASWRPLPLRWSSGIRHSSIEHSSTFNQCVALIQRISDAFNMASAIFNYSLRTSQLLNHSRFIAGMWATSLHSIRRWQVKLVDIKWGAYYNFSESSIQLDSSICKDRLVGWVG